MASERARGRSWLRLGNPIVWISTTALLLALTVWRSQLWEAPNRLHSVDAGQLSIVVLLNAVIAALWAIRSWILFRAAGRQLRLRDLVPFGALAFAVNGVTPASSGEVVRLYLLKARLGVGYAVGGAVILVERFVALFYLAASATACWLVSRTGFSPLSVVAAAALVGAASLTPVAGVRLLRLLPQLPGDRVVGTHRWARVVHGFGSLDGNLVALTLRPIPAFAFVSVTATIFAVFAIQLSLVVSGLGQSLDPLSAWGALGLSMVVGILSMLPFGLGATDVVLVTLLTLLGISSTTAGLAALALRLTTTVPLGLAGALAYAWLAAGAAQDRVGPPEHAVQ